MSTNSENAFAPGHAADGAAAGSTLHALLDDPQEWPAFGRPCTELAAPAGPESGPWESHVVLEGMHCAACALTIEDALQSVPGVMQAEVSAATQRARVVWQPGRVLPSPVFA